MWRNNLAVVARPHPEEEKRRCASREGGGHFDSHILHQLINFSLLYGSSGMRVARDVRGEMSMPKPRVPHILFFYERQRNSIHNFKGRCARNEGGRTSSFTRLFVVSEWHRLIHRGFTARGIATSTGQTLVHRISDVRISLLSGR